MADSHPWQVDVEEAEAHFSKLLARVEKGEEVVVARAAKPVARIVPYVERSARREPGFWKGQLTVPRDFDAPLPREVQDGFERPLP